MQVGYSTRIQDVRRSGQIPGLKDLCSRVGPKGCTEVADLAKEVEGLRQMVEDMKEMVAGLRIEDKGAETGSRVTTTGVNQDREEAAGKIRTEEMITGVEDEGGITTEERKEICAGAMLMATHAYTRNPESPLGKEINLQQWDTLIFKGEHAENEHWRLVKTEMDK